MSQQESLDLPRHTVVGVEGVISLPALTHTLKRNSICSNVQCEVPANLRVNIITSCGHFFLKGALCCSPVLGAESN